MRVDEILKGAAWRVRSRLTDAQLGDLRRLRAWGKLSADGVRGVQEARLEELLTHASRHVPYYRRVLRDAGVVSSSGRVDVARFSEIPILDKATIRRESHALLSDDIESRRWFENSSGGSTGEPLPLVQDREYHDWTEAIKMMFDEWSGRRIGERQIRLWGSERDTLGLAEPLRTRVGRWARNEQWINAFRMTPADIRAAIHCLYAFRPAQVLAYSGAIFAVARYAERGGMEVYSPRAIMSAGDTLFPYMRETVERVFRAPLFDRYGSREVGDVACECARHEGMHVVAPTHVVEILRPDGGATAPGEVGQVIVTPLINHVMPLIRYRIEDMGAWAVTTCPCGHPWPLLGSLVGRESDFFVASDGALVDGGWVGLPFWGREWVERFQVVQEAVGHIRAIVVLRAGSAASPKQSELDEMASIMRAAMGQQCRIDWEFVDDIATTPTGKLRYTISKLGDPSQTV